MNFLQLGPKFLGGLAAPIDDWRCRACYRLIRDQQPAKWGQ